MISEDVRLFILKSIPSVPYMEAVLLFHCAPERLRSADEVARALYLPGPRVVELLDALCMAGVIESVAAPTESFRYAPHSPDLHAAIASLASAYSTDLIAVTHLIHDSTRADAQRFADAFKLRRDR